MPNYEQKRKVISYLERLVSIDMSNLFHDAIDLLENRVQLRCSNHFIAHCFREVEGALRDTMQTLVNNFSEKFKEQGGKKNGGKANHKAEVKVFLEWLGVKENDDLWDKWLVLTKSEEGFAKRAHRDNLLTRKRVDHDYWDRHLDTLVKILQLFESKFAIVFNKIDQITLESSPCEETKEYLKKGIPRSRNVMHYFFSKNIPKTWFQVLKKAKYFMSAPEILTFPDGSKSYVGWPAGEYLKKVSPEYPEEIVEIINNLKPTENPYSFWPLIEALCQIPVKESIKAIDRVIEWIRVLKDLVDPTIYAKYFCIISNHLDDHEPILEALGILYQYKVEGQGYDSIKWEKLEDTYRVRKVIDEFILNYRQDSLHLLFRFMTELLDRVEKSLVENDKSGSERNNYTSVNFGVRQVKFSDRIDFPNSFELLTSVVKELGEKLIERGETEAVLTVCESVKSRGIVKRLLLYFLSLRPGENLIKIYTYIFDEQVLLWSLFWEERDLLLQRSFSLWNDENRLKYLDFVKKGPPDEEMDRRLMFRDQSASKKQEAKIQWQKWYLAPVLKELKPNEMSQFPEDIEKQNNYRDPENFHSEVTSGWVQPYFRNSVEELRSLSVAELVNYINSFKKDPKLRMTLSDDIMGLKDSIGILIQEDPNRYLGEINEFDRLVKEKQSLFFECLSNREIPLSQLSESNWNQVVCFLLKYLDEERYQVLDATIRVVSAAIEIKDKKSEINFSQKDNIWKLIENIFRKEPQYNLLDENSVDSYTYAINSSRGKALETAMSCLFWLDENGVKPDFENIKGKTVLLFEEILDNPTTYHSSLWAVFGLNLHTLHQFSSVWVKSYLPKILPENDLKRVNSTLEGWHYARKISLSLFPKMKVILSRIIVRGNLADNLQQRISEVLVRAVLNGDTDLDSQTDPVAVLGKSDNYLFKRILLDEIVKILEQISGNPEISRNVKQYVDHRLTELEGNEDDKAWEEFRNFHRWFAIESFEDIWLLESLEKITSKVLLFSRPGKMAKRLGKMSSDYSERVFAVIEKLIEYGLENAKTWDYYSYIEQIGPVIKWVESSNNSQVVRNAKALYSKLCSLGYKDVLDRNKE